MDCKKCGNKLKRNEEFCTVCGYYNGVVRDDGWQTDNGNNGKELDLSIGDNESNSEEFSYGDERFIEAFIGEDYKLIKSHFNIFALLLNWFYFLYRKLYITGGIGLIITYIIIKFYDQFFIWYILGTSVLFCFIFNPYYLFIIKMKIKRLEKKNDGSDDFTFTNICAENGGVNSLITFIVFLVFLVIVFFTKVYVQFNSTHNSRFWDENSTNFASCTQIAKLSYQEVTKKFDYGTVEEAVCKVVKSPSKNYEIYLKMKKDTQIVYVFYLGKDGDLIYRADTAKQNDLELKKANYTITPDEEKVLVEFRKFSKVYQTISKKSKLEKQLIDKKQNVSERLNYVITREEIIR